MRPEGSSSPGVARGVGGFGPEVTVDDGEARRELGYVDRVGIVEGLAELR